MSDPEFVITYLVTFEPDQYLRSVSNVRSITLAATTTDTEDAYVLAYEDLVGEFGVEVAAHFVWVKTIEEMELPGKPE